MELQQYQGKYILWTSDNGILFDPAQLDTIIEQEYYETDPSECTPQIKFVDVWETGTDSEKIELVLNQIANLDLQYINSAMELIPDLEYSENLII